MTEEIKLNLYQRINAVRKKIDYIKKDKSVSTGGDKTYKAVSHDQVCALTRDHMVEFGVLVFPSIITSKMNEPKVDKEGNIAKQQRYDATYEFKFVNIDDKNDFEIVKVEAHAMDNADKAPGKALSYAKKYAILKVFEIETGENDESSYLSADDFDLQFHLELIKNAETREDATGYYLKAKKEASAVKNAVAIKEIEKAGRELSGKFDKQKIDEGKNQ